MTRARVRSTSATIFGDRPRRGLVEDSTAWGWPSARGAAWPASPARRRTACPRSAARAFGAGAGSSRPSWSNRPRHPVTVAPAMRAQQQVVGARSSRGRPRGLRAPARPTRHDAVDGPAGRRCRRPRTRCCPPRRADHAADALQRGALARAIGAQQAATLAGAHRRSDTAMQTLASPVARVQAARFEHSERSAEVSVDHDGVALRTVDRRSLGDLLAEIEHHDARADLHDQAHVVLDHQHRGATLADAPISTAKSLRSLATIPAAGSSSSSRRGSVASAVAIINSRCCADEIAEAGSSATAARPTNARISSTLARWACSSRRAEARRKTEPEALDR